MDTLIMWSPQNKYLVVHEYHFRNILGFVDCLLEKSNGQKNALQDRGKNVKKINRVNNLTNHGTTKINNNK